MRRGGGEIRPAARANSGAAKTDLANRTLIRQTQFGLPSIKKSISRNACEASASADASPDSAERVCSSHTPLKQRSDSRRGRLMRLAAPAWWLREAARAAISTGDFARVLELTVQAQRRSATPGKRLLLRNRLPLAWKRSVSQPTISPETAIGLGVAITATAHF